MVDFSPVFQDVARTYTEFTAEVCARLQQQGVNLLEELARKAGKPADCDRYRQDAECLQAAALKMRFAARMQGKFEAFLAGQELSEKETLEAQPQEVSREVVRTVDCLTNHVAEPLWHLNMRMALLRGGLKTVDYSNPLSPAQVCGALCAVLAEQRVQPRTQLLLFRLVEKHLPERLASCYETINRKLCQAGVFPHLRYHLVEENQKGTVPAGAFGRDAAEAAAECEREAQLHVTALLRAQANRRDEPLRHTALGAPFGGMNTDGRGGADTLTETDVAFTIIALQSRYPIPRGRVYRSTPAIRELESLLIDQMLKSGDISRRRRLKRAMAESLARMGLVFSHLLKDRFIGRDLRDLLSHLYLPALKMAMLEGRFWSDAAHPGRRLIGLVCELGEYWMPTPVNDRTVYPQLHAVAERLTRDYVDDISVVEAIVRDLEDFAARMGQRASLTLNRTLESERGLARVGSAQAFAASEAAGLLADDEIPAVMQETLQVALAAFLAGLVLRDQARARSLTDIDKALRAAMGLNPDSAALPDARRLEQLAQALSAISDHTDATKALVDAMEQALARSRGLEGLSSATVKRVSSEASRATVTPVALTALPGQGFGQWFGVRTRQRDADGIEVDGPPLHWVLVWASPPPRRYLFVNRLGIRGELMDETVLAEKFASGECFAFDGSHANAWVRAVRAAASDREARY